MKSLSQIKEIIERYNELGETINAANFLIDEYGLRHPNFKGFELREKADPKYILMTTEGNFGESQIIRIPENTFDFQLELMLTLIAHEMVHVAQRQNGHEIPDRNEREWQAYYEMIFHKIYPNIPDVVVFNEKGFCKKALEYYKRMGEGSELQKKYAAQKVEVETLLEKLESQENTTP